MRYLPVMPRALALSMGLWLMSSSAWSSDCHAPLSLDLAMEAEQIFLFSITGLNVAQAKESSELRGSLRVEKIYRGAPPAATFIFSDSMWCGTRLVTGHRYLAFIAGPGKPLVLDDGTLLDLAAIGSDSQALADWLVTQILDGSSTGDEAWWQQSWTSLQIVPPPLPPQGAEHE